MTDLPPPPHPPPRWRYAVFEGGRCRYWPDWFPNEDVEARFVAAVKARDLVRASRCFDGRNAAEALTLWEGALPADLWADAVRCNWPRIEFPSRAGQRRIVRWFRAAGFLTDWPDFDLSDVLTVYRGAKHLPPRGVSWTLDDERAEWFARRFLHSHRGPAHVYQAAIPANGVLAVFNERQGKEVVVNPAMLRDIRVVRTLAA